MRQVGGMGAAEVPAVLDALDAAGVRVWLAGGWGVDALAGRQTRAHRDLDVLVDAAREAAALGALERLGYVVETDWRPVRVQVAAAGRGWVDVHPVAFDAEGNGIQAGPDGGSFHYSGLLSSPGESPGGPSAACPSTGRSRGTRDTTCVRWTGPTSRCCTGWRPASSRRGPDDLAP